MKYLLSLLLLFGTISPVVIAAPNALTGEISLRLATIQNNSIIGNSAPYHITAKDIALELLLEEIIKRESGGDTNACNGDHCQYGRGLVQLVSETEKTCEKALGRDLNPFIREDNLACARWLLDQPNGIMHWGDGGDWGSGPYPKYLITILYDN